MVSSNIHRSIMTILKGFNSYNNFNIVHTSVWKMFVCSVKILGSGSMPDITISGHVYGYDRAPIFNIKVSAYHDRKYVGHVFTNEAGKYQISVPSDTALSVCFDTHETLTNAKEWHPSVVANIDAKQDIVLNPLPYARWIKLRCYS